VTEKEKENKKIDLGSIIRSHRKKYQLTQQQLADKLGISYQLLQKYEYNKCRPSLERMFDITQVLEIDMNIIRNKS
jgi:transcriptional regulator with XRE-family HTH domain